MKRILIFLMLLVLLFSLIGCRQEPKPAFETDPETGMPVLSEERKAQIEAETGNELYYARYYGSYSGYDFFYSEKHTEAITSKSIAGARFTCGGGFSLKGYKGGEFESLEHLYRNGLVTKEDVWEMAKVHQFYHPQYYTGEWGSE